ncbi:MAG: hypothetical protein HKP41_08375 [Desulfobacterales bacterium]|nr:hypothetical protein [Deltaproteobacteria bacterium]MBT8362736.1 hypothetical protein [Deltaproteobacteria bacterium]NNK94351.1 hypothetical protein [Desulfobacterales bacterium]
MLEEEHKEDVAMGRIGYRPFWVLSISIVIRAVHQVGAAVYLSSFLLDEIAGPSLFYLLIVWLSGLALLISEWMRHRQIYREVAGLSTLVKLLLLGAAYHQYLPEAAMVLMAFMVSSIGAHVPKGIRHRLLF